MAPIPVVGPALKALGPLARLGLLAVLLWALTTIDLQSALQSLLTPF